MRKESHEVFKESVKVLNESCSANNNTTNNSPNLKYNPKSPFIYNRKVVNNEDLSKMTDEQKNKLILELSSKHYEACRENEQFRTKNFKQYLILRKMGFGD